MSCRPVAFDNTFGFSRPFVMTCQRKLNGDVYFFFQFSILLLLFLGVTRMEAQPQNAPFHHITLAEGLPNLYVSDITQDTFGFIWIGTWQGIYRYDGKIFTQITSIQKGARYVEADQKGGVWLSRIIGGPAYYDPHRDSLFRYTVPEHFQNGLVEVDEEGGVWLGGNDGIYRLEPDTHHFEFDNGQQIGRLLSSVKAWGGGRLFFIIDPNKEGIPMIGYRHSDGTYTYESFPLDANHPGSPVPYQMNDFDLLPIDSNKLLIINKNGWATKETEQSNWQFHPFGEEKISEPGSGVILDKNGNVWRRLESALMKINLSSKQTTIFRNDPKRPESILPVNQHFTKRGDGLFLDQQGVLWILRSRTGISRLNLYENDFGLALRPSGQPFKDVNCALELEDGSYWLGVRSVDTALFHIAANGSVIETYGIGNRPLVIPPGRSEGEELSHSYIWSLAKTKDGSIWAGAGGPYVIQGGLNRIRPGSKKVIRFTHDPNDDSSLPGNWVNELLVDGSDRLWMKTDSGICYINPETENIVRNPVKKEDLSQADIFWLTMTTREGHIILTKRPFLQSFIINHKSLEIDSFGIQLEGQRIRYEHQDKNGIIWFIADKGFGALAPSYKKIASWYSFDDIKYNVIAINSDLEGNIWLATDNGILKLQPETGQFFHFGYERGLQGKSFGYFDYKGPSGKIYFSGVGGINIFDPAEIKINPHPPDMVFTDIKLNGESAIPGSNAPVEQPIHLANKIKIGPEVSVISIDFAAIHFANDIGNKYKYKMEGFDKDWRDGGRIGNATYTNLAPGNYTFFIRGANLDGVWSEGTDSIKITILPPWYRTTLAYIIYVLLFTGALYSLYRFQLNRQLAAAETRRLKELDSFKSRFFTNITHEFRTPLTVIKGMAAQIHSQDKVKNLIKRNSDRLLNMVNQLLDLAKLESNSLEVNWVQGDVVPYLKYLTESCHSLAQDKNQNLAFFAKEEQLVMDYDEQKLQQMLINLLSNAIKFTPEYGSIRVVVDRIKEGGKDHLALSVQDSGRGMSEEEMARVFDRFYQVKDTQARYEEGTGIGLSLVKELTHLLEGRIEVESEQNKGSTFKVYLPIHRQAAVKKKKQDFDTDSETLSAAGIAATRLEAAKAGDSEKPLLLIIEDNADVVEYLASCLEADYQLVAAQNGQRGIEKAIETVPDLIISDVMMPEKNGYEVCDTLKKHPVTSHIPIVLLTAKADQPSKKIGLLKGADAYLSKPFDKEELDIRLKKLLELRRRLKEKYSNMEEVEIHRQAEPDPELLFLKKLEGVVLDNLPDENFKVEPHLCRAMTMSRPQLYRKLKALKGVSPSDYMRRIRMREARRLIKTTDKAIAEISEEMGYKNPSYFTRTYVEAFEETPSETRKTADKRNTYE